MLSTSVLVDSSLPQWLLYATPILALVCYALISTDWRVSALPLPPRPPGNLIFGNLFEVQKAIKSNQLHALMTKYAREYGDIVRVRAGPITEYFVNSDKAVKELFDKHSAVTSTRPRWIASSEHMNNGWNVLLLSASNPRWRIHRKVMHAHVGSIPRADAGLPFVHYETAKFMRQVTEHPDGSLSGWNLFKLILRYNYSSFSSQIFGFDIPQADNPVIADIHETATTMVQGTLPGAWMVDIFPVLDKLPMMLKPWERQNRARFRRDLKWCVEKLNRIREAKREGQVPDAMLPRIDEDPKSLQDFESMDEAAFLSFMMLVGAADTSAMSAWAFIEAMMLYPQVQEKARQNVLAVVGDRIPVYEDMESIPYVRCLMKEVWRWRPPVALGHPHVTTKELTYGGYRIPKGALLHLNAFAISHDPARHENPEEFMPERYAGDNMISMQSINLADVTQRDHFAFGAGRRVCPGYHVAERSFAVAIMRLLWAFKIEVAPGTPLPLDPSKFEGSGMPGAPDSRMPVTLRLLPGKEALIKKALDSESAARGHFEPLQDIATGQGAFDPLESYVHQAY